MYTQLGIQEMKKLYRQYCFVFEYSHLIKIGKPYLKHIQNGKHLKLCDCHIICIFRFSRKSSQAIDYAPFPLFTYVHISQPFRITLFILKIQLDIFLDLIFI